MIDVLKYKQTPQLLISDDQEPRKEKKMPQRGDNLQESRDKNNADAAIAYRKELSQREDDLQEP